MNFEVDPGGQREWNGSWWVDPCPPCPPPEKSGDRGETLGSSLRIIPKSSAATMESQREAIAALELENGGLRRIVVELLEKNQKLREQLRSVSLPVRT